MELQNIAVILLLVSPFVEQHLALAIVEDHVLQVRLLHGQPCLTAQVIVVACQHPVLRGGGNLLGQITAQFPQLPVRILEALPGQGNQEQQQHDQSRYQAEKLQLLADSMSWKTMSKLLATCSLTAMVGV